MTANVPTSIPDAAALYLARGMAAIPVHPGSKKAVGADWQAQRPLADGLSPLFARVPDANVGILLGEPSGGLVDVDLDCPEALVAAPFFLPPTGLISGRPGKPRSHWWYRPSEPPERTAQRVDLDDVMVCELRSTGGQSVAPPSLHPGGEAFLWHAFGEAGEPDAADLRTAFERTAAAALLARHWPGRGSRHNARLALAGGLLRAGWNEAEAEQFLRAVTAAAANTDHEDCAGVVRTTAERLASSQEAKGWPSLVQAVGSAVVGLARRWLGIADRPRPVSAPTPPTANGKPPVAPRVRDLGPPFRPFPVECLPAVAADFVRHAAAALGCDTSYVALPVLSVLAGAIGNSRTIRLKPSWHEPSVVWTCVVGESGTLKSQAWREAVLPLFRRQRARLAAHRDACAAHKDELRRRSKNDDSPEPSAPIAPCLVTSDVTVEALATLLEDNPRGFLLARDELAGWLASFTRYKGASGGTDLPNWLEIHRAGTVAVDRKTGDRKKLFVFAAAVSVAGGTQPGVLAEAMSDAFLSSGFAARVLFAAPPVRVKRWREDYVPAEVQAAYERLIDGLLALEMDADDDGNPLPFAVPLSPEAKAVWVDWYDRWALEQAAAEGDRAAALSKLEGYAARFALLHHVGSHVSVEADDRRAIGPGSVEAGIALAEWFAREAERLYDSFADTPDERQQRGLIDFIRTRGGEMTARELMRANGRKYPTSQDAEAALDALVAAGAAERVPVPAGRPGPKLPGAVRLRPTSDRSDSSPASPPTAPSSVVGLSDSSPLSDSSSDPTTHSSNGCAANDLRSSSSMSSDELSDLSDVGHRPPVPPEPGSDELSDELSDNGELSDSGAPKRPVTDTSAVVEKASVAEGYRLVTAPDQLAEVVSAVEESALVGLDTETTGLDPRTDTVRLLSLATATTDGGVFTYLVDCRFVDPSPLWDALRSTTVVCHNGLFDLQFLARLGFEPGAVRDTMLESILLHGPRKPRGFHSLEQVTLRETGELLDKAEQTSDWSVPALSAEQLAYAARDAAVLPGLTRRLHTALGASGQAAVAAIESRALPAVAWMSAAGVGFDAAAWTALSAAALSRDRELAARLDAGLPPRAGTLFRAGWNWDSPQQVKEALEAAGLRVAATDDGTLARLDHPMAAVLREYRSARRLATAYGPDWPKGAVRDGRLYPQWRQIGQDPGRMSCSSPTCHNLPRDPAYRRPFIAPPGRVLVKADYSQIQIRIAAKLSGDEALLAAYRAGQDLHALTAHNVLGVETPTKEQRQVAKSLNFGLLFGMGAPGLRQYALAEFGIAIDMEDARRYHAAFFRAYPGLARWHRAQPEGVVATRTLAGRRRRNVESLTWKLNTPVQGTEADGLKLALALLWERRAEMPGAFPVLAVHDEIVCEADASSADAVAALLTRCMVEAMRPLIDPVPVEVETRIAPTWGG